MNNRICNYSPGYPQKYKKIVWLCHYVNSEIGEIIGHKDISNNIAPWITDMVKLFENKEDVQIYIISPNYYNNKNINLTRNGVNYCFYKYTSFDIGIVYNQIVMLLTNYSHQKRNIATILKRIQPDLIHLFGSENTSYSVGFNKLKSEYRSLITIQGFVSSAATKRNIFKLIVQKERVKYERLINSFCNYYANGTQDAIDVLKKRFNSKAAVFNFQLPTYENIDIEIGDIKKKYDIVFFARVTEAKGIEDLLNAVAILKAKIGDISLVVVGGATKSYSDFLLKKCKMLNIEKNVTYAGFQETQSKAHEIVASAKVFVLPTHFDGMPGSLRETMKLGVPIIANNVGGIPELNSEKECVKLVPKKNIQQLADTIFEVLNNKNLYDKLLNNSIELINTKFSNQNIYNNVIDIYDKVITQYEKDRL